MENILSQINADNLDIKLTSEKLFINTAESSEAFASPSRKRYWQVEKTV